MTGFEPRAKALQRPRKSGNANTRLRSPGGRDLSSLSALLGLLALCLHHEAQAASLLALESAVAIAATRLLVNPAMSAPVQSAVATCAGTIAVAAGHAVWLSSSAGGHEASSNAPLTTALALAWLAIPRLAQTIAPQVHGQISLLGPALAWRLGCSGLAVAAYHAAGAPPLSIPGLDLDTATERLVSLQWVLAASAWLPLELASPLIAWGDALGLSLVLGAPAAITACAALLVRLLIAPFSRAALKASALVLCACAVLSLAARGLSLLMPWLAYIAWRVAREGARHRLSRADALAWGTGVGAVALALTLSFALQQQRYRASASASSVAAHLPLAQAALSLAAWERTRTLGQATPPSAARGAAPNHDWSLRAGPKRAVARAPEALVGSDGGRLQRAGTLRVSVGCGAPELSAVALALAELLGTRQLEILRPPCTAAEPLEWDEPSEEPRYRLVGFGPATSVIGGPADTRRQARAALAPYLSPAAPDSVPGSAPTHVAIRLTPQVAGALVERILTLPRSATVIPLSLPALGQRIASAPRTPPEAPTPSVAAPSGAAEVVWQRYLLDGLAGAPEQAPARELWRRAALELGYEEQLIRIGDKRWLLYIAPRVSTGPHRPTVLLAPAPRSAATLVVGPGASAAALRLGLDLLWQDLAGSLVFTAEAMVSGADTLELCTGPTSRSSLRFPAHSAARATHWAQELGSAGITVQLDPRESSVLKGARLTLSASDAARVVSTTSQSTAQRLAALRVPLRRLDATTELCRGEACLAHCSLEPSLGAARRYNETDNPNFLALVFAAGRCQPEVFRDPATELTWLYWAARSGEHWLALAPRSTGLTAPSRLAWALPSEHHGAPR